HLFGVKQHWHLAFLPTVATANESFLRLHQPSYSRCSIEIEVHPRTEGLGSLKYALYCRKGRLPVEPSRPCLPCARWQTRHGSAYRQIRAWMFLVKGAGCRRAFCVANGRKLRHGPLRSSSVPIQNPTNPIPARTRRIGRRRG